MASSADDSSISPRKRRGWRYSLRALLVVVTLAAMTCGWVRYRVVEQRRHAARIAAIQTYADHCKETYRKVDALAKANASGSEDFEYDASEYHFATAELALENSDTPTAIDELKEALRFAEGFVRENQVNMGGPGPDDEHIHRAFSQRLKIQLRLAELSPESIDAIRKEFAEGHYPWNRQTSSSLRLDAE
jgi:hypothetical protein